jgi:hypothetical protein
MFAFVFFIFFRLSFPVVLFHNRDINLHIFCHQIHAFSLKNPTFTFNPSKWIRSEGEFIPFDSAGHNFRCPLINVTALIFHLENVSLREERLYLNLFMALALKILFCQIF